MTEKEIKEILYEMDFSPIESKAFLEIIDYAKKCQKANGMDGLKTFISNKIDEVVDNEI